MQSPPAIRGPQAFLLRAGRELLFRVTKHKVETMEQMQLAGVEAYVLKTALSEVVLAAIRGQTNGTA